MVVVLTTISSFKLRPCC